MAEMEDNAMDRLLARLDMALFQVAIGDPAVEWRNTHG
jgi:hypothetical protein